MMKSCLRSFCHMAVAVAALSAPSLPADAAAHDEYWYRRVSFFNLHPVQPGDIVMLGNSLTDGAEWNELLGRDDVLNRGINSDVIAGVEERLEQVTAGRPSKIFVLIGINDVSHGLTPAEMAAAYSRMLEKMRSQSPSTRVYVQSVMPIDNSFGRYRNLRGREGSVIELNKLLRQVAESAGCVWVDLWPAMADQEGRLKRAYTNDGLHLTGAGYRAWADALLPYLNDTDE